MYRCIRQKFVSENARDAVQGEKIRKVSGGECPRPPTVKYDTKKALKYAAVIIGDLETWNLKLSHRLQIFPEAKLGEPSDLTIPACL